MPRNFYHQCMSIAIIKNIVLNLQDNLQENAYSLSAIREFSTYQYLPNVIIVAEGAVYNDLKFLFL